MAPAAASAGSVTTAPVSFRVTNVNRSESPCNGDGKPYTVQGTITAPAGALDGPVPAASLYVHGLGYSGSLFHYTKVKGYDFVGSLARKGMVSVVIDRLGYRGSGHPPGRNVCYGSEADYLHQIVVQLRSGAYTLKRRHTRAPKVRKIALVSHSAGGYATEAEAYSFGGIDGLVLLAFGDNGLSPTALTAGAQSIQLCGTGRADYVHFGQTAQEFTAWNFFDTDPRILAEQVRTRPLDPCGDFASALSATAADNANIPSIHVPVLVAAGTEDKVFPPHVAPRHAKMFSGSRDVTAVEIPRTAHAITLGRSRYRVQAVVYDWLRKRGYRVR